MTRVLLLCLFVSACSHDLSQIPVLDGGGTDGGNDAGIVDGSTEDVLRDTGPTDAGEDAYDAGPEIGDAGPSVPSRTNVTLPFSVHGATALGNDVVLAGVGTRNGNADAVVARIDSAGRDGWVQSFATETDDALNDIVSDGERMIAVGSSGDQGWILELNARGTVESSRRFGGLELTAVEMDPTGFVAVGSRRTAMSNGVVIIQDGLELKAFDLSTNASIQLLTVSLLPEAIFVGGSVDSGGFFVARIHRETNMFDWYRVLSHENLDAVRSISIHPEGETPSILLGGDGDLMVRLTLGGGVGLGHSHTQFASILGLRADGDGDWINGIVERSSMMIPRAGRRNVSGRIDFYNWGPTLSSEHGFDLPRLLDGRRVQVVVNATDPTEISVTPFTLPTSGNGACGATYEADGGAAATMPIADLGRSISITPLALEPADYPTTPTAEEFVTTGCASL